MIDQFFFFFLAIVAVAAALGMVLARNPVTSALWLVLNLFCVAGLYILLHATFLGVIQVLIYAGAIMVLFLFVIMLLNLAALPRPSDVQWLHVVAFVLGVAILAQLVFVVAAGFGALPEPVDMQVAAETGSASELARHLFTTYLVPFEIIGILLLVATIGALMFAKKTFV